MQRVGEVSCCNQLISSVGEEVKALQRSKGRKRKWVICSGEKEVMRMRSYKKYGCVVFHGFSSFGQLASGDTPKSCASPVRYDFSHCLLRAQQF